MTKITLKILFHTHTHTHTHTDKQTQDIQIGKSVTLDRAVMLDSPKKPKLFYITLIKKQNQAFSCPEYIK